MPISPATACTEKNRLEHCWNRCKISRMNPVGVGGSGMRACRPVFPMWTKGPRPRNQSYRILEAEIRAMGLTCCWPTMCRFTPSVLMPAAAPKESANPRFILSTPATVHTRTTPTVLPRMQRSLKVQQTQTSLKPLNEGKRGQQTKRVTQDYKGQKRCSNPSSSFLKVETMERNRKFVIHLYAVLLIMTHFQRNSNVVYLQ